MKSKSANIKERKKAKQNTWQEVTEKAKKAQQQWKQAHVGVINWDFIWMKNKT